MVSREQRDVRNGRVSYDLVAAVDVFADEQCVE